MKTYTAKTWKNFRIYINDENGNPVGYFQHKESRSSRYNYEGSTTYVGSGNPDEILDAINKVNGSIFGIWNGVKFNDRNFNMYEFTTNPYIRFEI